MKTAMTIPRSRLAHSAGAFRARLMARTRILAPIAMLAATGCGGNGNAPAQLEDPVPNLDGGLARQWQARPTLVQSLRLLNPGLRQGDTLKLESTIRNVSNQPVNLSYVVCELDIEGELETMAPLILCFAYSVTGTLAPGEQVTGHLQRVVTSPPGRYTISIRHLLDPAVWVPAELTVHPR